MHASRWLLLVVVMGVAGLALAVPTCPPMTSCPCTGADRCVCESSCTVGCPAAPCDVLCSGFSSTCTVSYDAGGGTMTCTALTAGCSLVAPQRTSLICDSSCSFDLGASSFLECAGGCSGRLGDDAGEVVSYNQNAMLSPGPWEGRSRVSVVRAPATPRAPRAAPASKPSSPVDCAPVGRSNPCPCGSAGACVEFTGGGTACRERCSAAGARSTCRTGYQRILASDTGVCWVG